VCSIVLLPSTSAASAYLALLGDQWGQSKLEGCRFEFYHKKGIFGTLPGQIFATQGDAMMQGKTKAQWNHTEAHLVRVVLEV
jgi:hypothetical protein